AGMSETILDQRRRLLSKLDKLLASMPVRSQLIIGGDFNVTLTPMSRIAGYGLLQKELSEKERADQDLLMRLLQRHKLSALNTWSKKGTAATYLHAKGRSQIDYVCARQADGEPQDISPWWVQSHIDGRHGPSNIEKEKHRNGLYDRSLRRYFKLRIAYMRVHRHDMRGLFGVINLLCPRKGVQRIRLRDDAGHLMNGLEECKVLAAYARELFMASNSPRLPLLRIPEEILDIRRWHQAASKLKAEKAAPNATPPLRNWKQHSKLIVPILHAQAVHHLCSDTPHIPGEWTEVQLAWLAKPGKCPSKPSNLRTVGLMAGDTKMFMTVLKEAVQAEITQGLWDIPQFAYRKMASTTDALLRGSLHCIQVRALAGQVNTDVTTRLLTGALPELQGGLMLSLDLAKAFDCMPFGVMYESLREVGVSDELSRLIVETHRQSVCIVRHCGHSETVQMKRGLRQGCPLAPSVFTAWTIKLCRLLGTEWCREHTSFFADDVHGHWIIRTCQEFHEARARALKLIAALHRSGMKVNFDKSMAVLLLRGSAATGIKQRFVKWDRNRYVFVLGTDDCTGREVRLPIQDKMDYLGATLSYGAMEMQTVQFRATKAWANYTKLRFYDVRILPLQSFCVNYYKVLQEEQQAPPRPPTGSRTLEDKEIAKYQTKCILCAQMVKVLAVRKLYSEGTLDLHLHSRRGPALKQHEKEKQYMQVERIGIKAMLRGHASKPAPSEATTTKQATPSASDPSSELLVNVAQGDAPGASNSIGPGRSNGYAVAGTRSVRLHNPHNLCYMNAGILALVHALKDTDLPRGLRQLRDAIDGQQGNGLNLATHFGLRALFRGWTLDNRQKDAAEFTGFLLNKVGFGHMSWESRVMGRGVHQVMDGTGMLYLDLPHGDCDLQELVSAWSYQAHTHAIVIETGYFIVQLGRFPHRGKSMIQVRFAQEVNVPVFTTGIDCEWVPYIVVAGLLHFGDSPDSGHYRAALREQADWWITDDGAAMSAELEVPMEQEEELRIWAAFKQAAPQTAESLALEVDRSAKFHKPEGKGDSKGPDAKMTDEKEAENNPGSSQGSRGRQSNGQGSKGHGQQGGYQRSRNQNSWGSGRWSNWKKDDEDEAIAMLKTLVGQLARLCLRHEDSINMWRAESSFVLFVRTGIPGSLVPSLFAAKTEWQKLKEEQPEKVKRPMRNMLFSCLLKEMFDRLQQLRGDTERRGSMEKLGWLKGEDFQRLRWDSKLKKNVKDEESSVISYEDVLAILQSMLTRCNTVEALLRFHPTRPITEQMQEGTVAFLLQFSLQNDNGLQLFADMNQLCHCGSTMVCGIEVKRERSSRSQLANQISRLLNSLEK
ncbi:unnamed protein product, partial [Symbiodinium necroappetens]